MEKFRITFEKDVRPVLFMMVTFVAFGLMSLNLLLTQEPDWFARLGSVMVVWAVVNFSIGRERYSQAASRWNRRWVVEHLNQIRDLQALQTKSLNLTFDIHATQIAQIANDINKPNPFVESDPERLEAFCADVQRRIETSTVEVETTALIEKLSQLENDYQWSMDTNTRWTKTLWAMEVILLVWGTSQWGYGDCLVTWFHVLESSCG